MRDETGFETSFGGAWPWGRSGALSKKPRVMRGSWCPRSLLSRFEGLVLAEQKGFKISIKPTQQQHGVVKGCCTST